MKAHFLATGITPSGSAASKIVEFKPNGSKTTIVTKATGTAFRESKTVPTDAARLEYRRLLAAGYVAW